MNTFDRNSYVKAIKDDATYSDDATFVCSECAEEAHGWEVSPTRYQPPKMPTGLLCIDCWATEAADRWEESQQEGS